jgi:hypothetical protein
MSKAKFERVTRSDNDLYGPKHLLLCGFSADAQSKFLTVLDMVGLADIAVTWANHDNEGLTLKQLMALENGSGWGVDSQLPRAVVVAGITERQLHSLMKVCRRSGMKEALWAALTPTSEKWPLSNLLAELADERRQLAALKNKRS